MADDDDGMLSEEQTESFLVNSESVSGLSFPTASGVDVGGVGKAIVGSIGFAFALGINTLINAVSTAYAGLIDGVRGFIAGGTRSEERRVGKECLTQCRSRWSPYH